jgi:hypothetical protein
MLGNKVGAYVRASIVQYNGDGTVAVNTDHTGANSQHYDRLMLPASYITPDGSFIGGCPDTENQKIPVFISQQQGEWVVNQYVKPDNTFNTNVFDELKPGRILIQTKKALNRILLDPNEGIKIGNATSSFIIDTNTFNKKSFTKNIISHNIEKELSFTLSSRKINGIIARDKKQNSGRDLYCSMLDDTNYEDYLSEVGFDPTRPISLSTSGLSIRNLPLVENREIVYEFANVKSLKYTTDQTEYNHYETKSTTPLDLWKGKVIKQDSRAYTLGLSLDYPNHLMEEVKGTIVDAFGNILDLNRNILPIGEDKASFTKNNNLKEAFKEIRDLHRRSIAYHFEINARKSDNKNSIYPGMNINKQSDYARERSRFFIDIDKEGQFKINIPASSETGNVPLLTRYENSSNIAFNENETNDPNLFILTEDNKDIYHDSFAAFSKIDILDSKKNSTAPIDRFTNTKIKLGTAYHDIMMAGYQFTTARITDDPGGVLIRYMPDLLLNDRQNSIQYPKIISDTIYNSGDKANAGGRSGNINLDGFISLNIGANTVDKQSLWLDTAGGVVSTIGRDLNGISYCASLDGDMLVQIGGTSPIKDSRFPTGPSNSIKDGVLDIRVLKEDGQITIVRIDEKGVTISTYGTCEIAAQQDLILRSNSNILMEAPNIIMYSDSPPGMARVIQRNGVQEI